MCKKNNSKDPHGDKRNDSSQNPTHKDDDTSAPDPHECPLNHNCRAKCLAWDRSGGCLAGARDHKEIKRNISNLPAALRWFKRNHKWHERGRMTNLGKLRLVFRKPVRSAVNKMLADRLDGLTAKIETVFSRLQNNAEALDGLRVNDEDELVTLEHTMAYLDEGLGELADLVESGCLTGTGDKTGKSGDACCRSQRKIVDIPPSDDEQWVRITEAAKMIGKHRGTISHWAETGKIRDNGKKGHLRRVLKTDILLVKQTTEEADSQRDWQDLQDDSRRIK